MQLQHHKHRELPQVAGRGWAPTGTGANNPHPLVPNTESISK